MKHFNPSGCWSTAPHAVALTIMREHHYWAYLYMLCRLMYWCMLLIYTKQLSGVVVDMDSPQCAATSFFAATSFLTCNNIQGGGWPPFWKIENRNNSAVIWDVFTKFGTQVDMDRPQRALTSFLTYSKIQDGGRSLQCWSIELRSLPCISNLLKS